MLPGVFVKLCINSRPSSSWSEGLIIRLSSLIKESFVGGVLLKSRRDSSGVLRTDSEAD